MTRIEFTVDELGNFKVTNEFNSPKNKYYLPYTGNALEYYGLLKLTVDHIAGLEAYWDKLYEEAWELYVPYLPNCVDLRDVVDSIYNSENFILKVLDYARADMLEIPDFQYPSGEYESKNLLGIEGGAVQSILPDWTTYIPDKGTVLFLSKEDEEKYRSLTASRFCTLRHEQLLAARENALLEIQLRHYLREVFLVVPTVSKENFKGINDLCIDLKNRYENPKVVLLVSHFLASDVRYLDNTFVVNAMESTGEETREMSVFDKIVTTNSTGVLPPLKSKKLDVLCCLDPRTYLEAVEENLEEI